MNLCLKQSLSVLPSFLRVVCGFILWATSRVSPHCCAGHLLVLVLCVSVTIFMLSSRYYLCVRVCVCVAMIFLCFVNMSTCIVCIRDLIMLCHNVHTLCLQ